MQQIAGDFFPDEAYDCLIASLRDLPQIGNSSIDCASALDACTYHRELRIEDHAVYRQRHFTRQLMVSRSAFQ